MLRKLQPNTDHQAGNRKQQHSQIDGFPQNANPSRCRVSGLPIEESSTVAGVRLAKTWDFQLLFHAAFSDPTKQVGPAFMAFLTDLIVLLIFTNCGCWRQLNWS